MFNNELICKYYHTIKNLKFIQIFYRIYYKVQQTKNVNNTLSFELNYYQKFKWQGYQYSLQSIFYDDTACFLNEKGDISRDNCWDDVSKSKLWLYNLHYLDDLNSKGSDYRVEYQHLFIKRWINENPISIGSGWEPYTLSLRLVNLIKWSWRHKVNDLVIIESIAKQAYYLSTTLEFHILGNHLFANAKALVFAGSFLEGKLGDKLLKRGLYILSKELEEQFLDDGAHYELSPMYHSVMLWDLLELVELSRLNERLNIYDEAWSGIASNGLSWLMAMCHPDEQISFFNDASMNIAPVPNDILLYAKNLSLLPSGNKCILKTNKSSGYTSIIDGDSKLIFNHSQIGPSYQPGHAHADSLSFELSVACQRIFVNSGTSCYGESEQRHKERSTSSHNTVEVNSCNSSEVWAGFRVARRANSYLLSANEFQGTIAAEHDGYSRIIKNLRHKRILTLKDRQFICEDSLSKPVEKAVANYYLHPSVSIFVISKYEVNLATTSGDEIYMKSTEEIKISNTYWHPEFGRSVSNKCLQIHFTHKSTISLQW